MRSKRSKTKKVSKKVQPTFLYANVQERWSNGEGRRNTVSIENGGPAVKKVEALGANGHVTKTKTRKLTAAEKEKILRGVFVPGLWRNCSLGVCA
jgi:hypothetical protein